MAFIRKPQTERKSFVRLGGIMPGKYVVQALGMIQPPGKTYAFHPFRVLKVLSRDPSKKDHLVSVSWNSSENQELASPLEYFEIQEGQDFQLADWDLSKLPDEFKNLCDPAAEDRLMKSKEGRAYLGSLKREEKTAGALAALTWASMGLDPANPEQVARHMPMVAEKAMLASFRVDNEDGIMIPDRDISMQLAYTRGVVFILNVGARPAGTMRDKKNITNEDREKNRTKEFVTFKNSSNQPLYWLTYEALPWLESPRPYTSEKRGGVTLFDVTPLHEIPGIKLPEHYINFLAQKEENPGFSISVEDTAPVVSTFKVTWEDVNPIPGVNGEIINARFKHPRLGTFYKGDKGSLFFLNGKSLTTYNTAMHGDFTKE